MIQQIFTTYLKSLISFLVQNPQFLEGIEGQKILNNQKDFPSALKQYLENTNQKKLLEDIKKALIFLQEGFSLQSDSELLKSFGYFLTGDFFFLHIAQSKDNGWNTFEQEIFEILSGFYPVEREETVYDFLKKIDGNTPYIVVQSPCHLSFDQKKKIFMDLKKQHTFLFPRFDRNKDLLGGFRILIDGNVFDHSWFNEIHYLTAFYTS